MGYRYLGNKSRLKGWIADAVAERVPKGGTVIDPMCGTAVVSRELADRGFRVVASDQLRFPTLHAKARLLHDGAIGFEPIGSSYLECLRQLNELAPVKGFFWKEYSDGGRPANGTRARRYLTADNAARVDAIRQQIVQWRRAGLKSLAADLLLHDLILAVNRVANIAGTYGFYRSSWNKDSLVPLELRPTPTMVAAAQHQVLQGPAASIVSQLEVDAIYLDPPYTKRQYAGNYHLPETLAQEDEPEAIGDGGLRPWAHDASDFCYRRKAAAAFETILNAARARHVFVSYSDDAHLDKLELLKLLSEYGAVELRTKQHERFRSNGRVARQGDVHEHLYILEMRDVGATKSGGSLD